MQSSRVITQLLIFKSRNTIQCHAFAPNMSNLGRTDGKDSWEIKGDFLFQILSRVRVPWLHADSANVRAMFAYREGT